MAKQRAIEVGSCVWLISGGPCMTVLRCTSKDIDCIWFTDAGDEVNGHTFPIGVLELVPKRVRGVKGNGTD